MGLFKGSSTTNRADKISSFQATTCDFGTAVPALYGTSKIAPNLIKYANFTAVEKRTTTKSGKSKSTQIDYNYYADVQLALGEGALDGLGSVWVSDTKYGSIASVTRDKEGGSSAWSVHLGDVDDETYGKLAYVEGNIYLGQNTASMPSYNFETRGRLRSTGNNVDANPAYVIKDILETIGLGDYIDSTSWENYASFCRNADLLISTPADTFSEQKKAQEVIKELLTLTNTYMFWSVDRFKFVPREPVSYGDWQPNTTITYDIGHDDLIPQSGAPLSFSRKTPAEIYNYITVTFTNRANDYEDESVSYQDTADIAARGAVSTSIEAKWFHTKERAVRYARMVANKSLIETNQYTLVLDWGFSRLEPGDLIRVTDSAVGLSGKVMMVSEVSEAKTGVLTVKAVGRPDGTYSDAQYTVRDEYQYVDYNIDPGDTDDPLIIIPPADLVTSANGVELWLALRGKTSAWGGCEIYGSDTDGGYEHLGTHEISSYYGTTIAAMEATDTTVTVTFGGVKTVELLTGTQDPAAGKTDIWINGEVVAYTTATLVGSNTWTLDGLTRGKYGTTAAAHAAGEAMTCLDGGLYVIPLTKYYIGKTVYLKFPAMNYLHTNTQDYTELDYYNAVVNIADLPNCTELTAYNKYRELADDVVRYDIVVGWTPPDFASYQQAQVWYKTSGAQVSSLGVIPEGTSSNNLGSTGKWQFGGQGYDTVTIPQAVIGDTYTIAVCTQDIYGDVEAPDQSAQIEIAVALKSEIPDTPANLGTSLGVAFNIYWDEVRNADIKYYEVRLDASVGSENGLIARTTEHSITTDAITSRTGTIYVYAVSAYSKVSAPAKVTYNYAIPDAPTLTAESKQAGIECSVEAVPTDCNGVHWYFDGTDSDNDLTTTGNTYFYQANAGVYDISACYTDYFGDGTKCNAVTVSVAAYIDDALIKSEGISVDKLSEDAQEAIKNGGVNSVNIAVHGILDSGSALVLQPDGSYALVASNGEKLTGLYANEDGVMRLQGDYIHITGDTQIDGSVITNNMIAGGITADKLNVSSLSAICATIGTLRTATSGARMELESNQLRVYDSNNVLRVRLGVW